MSKKKGISTIEKLLILIVVILLVVFGGSKAKAQGVLALKWKDAVLVSEKLQSPYTDNLERFKGIERKVPVLLCQDSKTEGRFHAKKYEVKT